MHVILVFVVLILIYNTHKQLRLKDYCILIALAIFALVLMHSGEALMNRVQINSKEKLELSFDILSILRSEFSFVLVSFQNAMTKVIQTGECGLRFFNDIISGIFAWLPSRFKPAGITSLEAVNTIYVYGSTIYGGVPTDFISTSIYELNIVGIVILPIVYGTLIRKFDKKVRPLIKSDYYKVIYILGCFYFMKAVAYGDYANIMSNIFTLVWGHFFMKIICVGFRKR